MELIEGSETSANYPKEYIQDSKHGESLKSRILLFLQSFGIRNNATKGI